MNELIVLENLTPAVVFTERGGDPIIDKIRDEVLSVDRDISTEEGRKSVASLAHKVARSKTFLDEMGKTFASDLKKKTKAIDTERARIWDALEAIQKEVRQPLTDFENAEKNRIDFMERTILHIINCGIGIIGDAPQPIGLCLRELEVKIVIDDSFKEFKDRAIKARDESLAKLNSALEKQMREAAEREELDRLRKAEAERLQWEREQAIKAEAAENARRIAEEKAASEALMAAQKAEADRRAIEQQKRDAEERERNAVAAQNAAEEKAVLDAKAAQERADREKEVAIKAERERIEAARRAEAEAAEKREADIKHRSAINNAALAAVVKIIKAVNVTKTHAETEDEAKAVIEAIARKQIPHITISY